MKIGVMNNPSASVYDEIELFGKAKYDFVDLTIEGPTAFLDVKRVQTLLDKYDLSVVGHTDPCIPFAYPIKGIRKACFEELERYAKILSALGAKVMNIHPCYNSPLNMKQDLIEQNIETLIPLEQMASNLGLTLVLENYIAPFDRVSTFKTILKEVPGLKVHLDFGHTNIWQDDGETFCKNLGHDIMHVHFSDNRSNEDDHLPLGVGSVDWKKAVSDLKMIGYDKTITLEITCDDHTVLFQYLDISRRLILDLWNR